MWAIHSLSRRIILFCCFLVTAGQLLGQSLYPVTISLMVQPPYSPHISDYTSQPGKIMATLTNTSPNGGSVQVYLLGSITSSGGINIFTDPAYKMPEPLTLFAGQPYMLNQFNIEQVFSESHLVFNGITKQEVINGNGLPEDEYQICIRAYEYNSGQPVSDENPLGCATINITSVEPRASILMDHVCFFTK